MTAKPSPVGTQVGIQQYSFTPGYVTGEGEFSATIETDSEGAYVTHADHVAVLNRVREMLEAKAKEWDNWADMHLDGEALTVANKCHFDLLVLASTLGDQPASGLEARCERLEAALRLLYLDVLQGADPASKECQERTGSFAKARAALTNDAGEGA